MEPPRLKSFHALESCKGRTALCLWHRQPLSLAKEKKPWTSSQSQAIILCFKRPFLLKWSCIKKLPGPDNTLEFRSVHSLDYFVSRDSTWEPCPELQFCIRREDGRTLPRAVVLYQERGRENHAQSCHFVSGERTGEPCPELSSCIRREDVRTMPRAANDIFNCAVLYVNTINILA